MNPYWDVVSITNNMALLHRYSAMSEYKQNKTKSTTVMVILTKRNHKWRASYSTKQYCFKNNDTSHKPKYYPHETRGKLKTWLTRIAVFFRKKVKPMEGGAQQTNQI